MELTYRNSKDVIDVAEVAADVLEVGDKFAGGGTVHETSIPRSGVRTVQSIHRKNAGSLIVTYSNAQKKHFSRTWTPETRVYLITEEEGVEE